MIPMTDVKVKCPQCGWNGTIGDCKTDCEDKGLLGCPVPDCGTIIDGKIRVTVIYKDGEKND
jgi:hypothetical protein